MRVTVIRRCRWIRCVTAWRDSASVSHTSAEGSASSARRVGTSAETRARDVDVTIWALSRLRPATLPVVSASASFMQLYQWSVVSLWQCGHSAGYDLQLYQWSVHLQGCSGRTQLWYVQKRILRVSLRRSTAFWTFVTPATDSLWHYVFGLLVGA